MSGYIFSWLYSTDLGAGAVGIGLVRHSVRRPTWPGVGRACVLSTEKVETNDHSPVRTFDATKEDDVGPGHLVLKRNKKTRLQLEPRRPQPPQSPKFVTTSLEPLFGTATYINIERNYAESPPLRTCFKATPGVELP